MAIRNPLERPLRNGDASRQRGRRGWFRSKGRGAPNAADAPGMIHEEDLDHLGALHRIHR